MQILAAAKATKICRIMSNQNITVIDGAPGDDMILCAGQNHAEDLYPRMMRERTLGELPQEVSEAYG